MEEALVDQPPSRTRQWSPALAIAIALLTLSVLAPELGGRAGLAALQATPDIATPAATPVAPGCGNEASGPTEVAEVFIAAATANNLERAALCFSPDHQPASWDDVFLGGSASARDDLSACRGRPYTVTEAVIRPRLSAIIFTFDLPCVVASLDPWQRDLYDDAESLEVTTVVVQTGFFETRWYVQDAFTLVPD